MARESDIVAPRPELSLLCDRILLQRWRTGKSWVWLNVPFRERNAAKRLGAIWDPAVRCWRAPWGRDVDLSLFEPWLPEHWRRVGPFMTRRRSLPGGIESYEEDREIVLGWGDRGSIDLDVPFEEKDEATRIGGIRWDPGEHTWYVPLTENVVLFKRWIPLELHPAVWLGCQTRWP